jgi:hypothetical protein
VLWLLGFIGHFGGALIHLLLVIAVVVLIIQLIQGRRLLPTPFSTGSVNKPCVLAIGLHTLNAIMHSLRSNLTMKNHHGICSYQFVTCFSVEFPKRRPETDPLASCRIQFESNF